MTPVQCQQCHSEIAACPHCGFPLDEAEQPIVEQHKSPLGMPVRNLPFGIASIVTGVLGLVGSLFLIMGTALGLAFFVVSALAMAWGISRILGHIVADCPFCGQKVHVASYVQNFTCRHCRAISVRKDNYLELL